MVCLSFAVSLHLIAQQQLGLALWVLAVKDGTVPIRQLFILFSKTASYPWNVLTTRRWISEYTR